jgi:hypothetical protein
MNELSRRDALSMLAAVGLSTTELGRFGASQTQAPAVAPELVWPPVVTGIGPAFPTHDPATVKEVVGASHRSLDRVKELVSRQPTLAKAVWDWGFGDWESALGAAAHTGQRAIAEYLLEQGASPTIFSAAMLGHTDVVKAMIAAQPGVERRRGPHGITLLAHARAGGASSAATLAYLESVDGADARPTLVPITADERARLAGSYRFGPGPRDVLVVDVVTDRLGMTRVGAGRLLLHRVGSTAEWVFFPSGAESVRIQFDDATLTVTDGDGSLIATKKL